MIQVAAAVQIQGRDRGRHAGGQLDEASVRGAVAVVEVGVDGAPELVREPFRSELWLGWWAHSTIAIGRGEPGRRVTVSSAPASWRTSPKLPDPS